MLVASPAFLAVLAVLQLTWAAHTQPLRASGARCCTDEASRLDTHWRTPAAGRLERQRSAPLKNKVCSSVPRKRVSHISRVSRQSRPSGSGPAKNGQQSAQHRARRVTNLEKPDALKISHSAQERTFARNLSFSSVAAAAGIRASFRGCPSTLHAAASSGGAAYLLHRSGARIFQRRHARSAPSLIRSSAVFSTNNT